MAASNQQPGFWPFFTGLDAVGTTFTWAGSTLDVDVDGSPYTWEFDSSGLDPNTNHIYVIEQIIADLFTQYGGITWSWSLIEGTRSFGYRLTPTGAFTTITFAPSIALRLFFGWPTNDLNELAGNPGSVHSNIPFALRNRTRFNSLEGSKAKLASWMPENSLYAHRRPRLTGVGTEEQVTALSSVYSNMTNPLRAVVWSATEGLVLLSVQGFEAERGIQLYKLDIPAVEVGRGV